MPSDSTSCFRSSDLSVLLLATTAALACGCHDTPAAIVGVSPPRATERTVHALDGAAPELSPVPDDFRSTMTRVGDRFLSLGHAQRFEALVWANAAAQAHWDSPGEMPAGAMLVEEAIVRESGADRPGGLLIMEKREGGWRFVVVTADGDVVGDARVASCETCHHEAKGGVFAFDRLRAPKAAKETPPNR